MPQGNNGRKPKRENFVKQAFRHTMYALKRVGRWIKRMFFGGAKEWNTQGDFAVESPAKLYREAFFRKKSAVVAAVFLITLFLFVYLLVLTLAFRDQFFYKNQDEIWA